MHNKGVPGSARSPNIHYCSVVAVEEELLSWPLMPPEEACKGNGVELLPLNWSVPEFKGARDWQASGPCRRCHSQDCQRHPWRVPNPKSHDLVQWGSGIKARPFQEGRNLSHQAISRRASRFMVTWWCGRRAEVERSIKQCRKMQPAGMIRQAKFSLPIKDRSSLFRQLLRVDQDWSLDINSWSLSSGREVSMGLVSIKIPRNTNPVARGMPTWEATWRMVLTLWAQTDEWAGPTVK